MRDDNVVTKAHAKEVSYSEDDCLRHAVSDYTTAILMDQNNPEYVYKRGVAYANRGRNYADECLSDLQKAVELDGNNATYCLEYAKRLIDMGDGRQDTIEDARQYLEMAANTSSNGDMEYYSYCLRALQSIEDESARRAGISLYTKVADDVDGEEMSSIANQLQDFLGKNDDLTVSMVEHLKEVSKDHPNSLNLKCEYGVALRMSGQNEEAITVLTEVIEQDPTYFAAYEQRVRAECSLKSYEESIEDISIAIQHDDLTRYHVYRGDAHFNAGEYDEAIGDYLYAASNGSNMSAYSYYSVGQSYRMLEEYGRAVTYLSKAIPEGLPDELKADCYQYWADSEYHLGSVALDVGDKEKAKEHYSAAVNRYYDAIKWLDDDALTVRNCYWAGQAHDNLGEHQKAYEDYRKASDLVDDELYQSALYTSAEVLGVVPVNDGGLGVTE